MERQEERQLVDRCLSGDPEAWGEFVRSYGPLLRYAAARVLRRLGRGSDAAGLEDLTQGVLAFLADPGATPLRKFRWECPLPHFLAVVASQRCMRSLRSRQASWEESGADPLLEEPAA